MDRDRIAAAAAAQLLFVDNSVGTRYPFAEVAMVDRFFPSSTPSTSGPAIGDAIGPITRAAIERAVEPLVLTWVPVSAWSDLEEQRSATRSGSGAVVHVGEPSITGADATVAVGLACGTLCGVYLTYSLEEDGEGRWSVTGTVGPIGMS